MTPDYSAPLKTQPEVVVSINTILLRPGRVEPTADAAAGERLRA
jgi:hypothetical protein